MRCKLGCQLIIYDWGSTRQCLLQACLQEKPVSSSLVHSALLLQETHLKARAQWQSQDDSHVRDIHNTFG